MKPEKVEAAYGKVEPGPFVHYEGGRYRVLFVARDSTNAREGNRLVVYVSLTYGTINARDEVEFVEPVEWPDGVWRPRFMPGVALHNGRPLSELKVE